MSGASSVPCLMHEGIDAVVLYNELACPDVLPVQWQALQQPPEAFALQGMEEANTLLLQACVAVEEHPARDKHEDLGPLAGELARLDFKLNLILQLLDRLVPRDPMPAPTPVRFNALGASWELAGATPPALPGLSGLLRIQLRSSLPQPLEWPAEVTQVTQSQVQARFIRLPAPVGELLQKLAFLRHRRQVAGVRQGRLG